MLIEIGKSLIVDVLWCSYVCLGILNMMMQSFEKCSCSKDVLDTSLEATYQG